MDQPFAPQNLGGRGYKASRQPALAHPPLAKRLTSSKLAASCCLIAALHNVNAHLTSQCSNR